VRKKLIEAGIEIMEQRTSEQKLLKQKIVEMRNRGLRYQAIADLFNLWKVAS
jgi:hypothetical protein